jgi:MFS family permease
LAAVIFLGAFASAVTLSINSFIPLYLVDHFGFGRESAAAYMALVFSGGLWVSTLGGYLFDCWGRIPVILAACFITGPILYLLNLVPYGLGLIALLISIGMCMYVQAPVLQAYIVENTSVSSRSTIAGLYFFGGSEGSALMTPLIGYLIDELGFYLSFTIVGVFLFTVTLTCAAFLWHNQD